LFMAANSPSSQVSFLKSTALAPLVFPSPPHTLPSDRAYILHKDDINKPDLTRPLQLTGVNVGERECAYV
jgi:hypothetical protein